MQGKHDNDFVIKRFQCLYHMYNQFTSIINGDGVYFFNFLQLLYSKCVIMCIQKNNYYPYNLHNYCINGSFFIDVYPFCFIKARYFLVLRTVSCYKVFFFLFGILCALDYFFFFYQISIPNIKSRRKKINLKFFCIYPNLYNLYENHICYRPLL